MKNLILEGALEISGIDSESGEFLYSITPKMQQIMPDIYEDHLNQVNKDILNLWEKGYINVDFLSQNPTVTMSKKGLDQKEISKLSKKEMWALEEIKRILIN